MIADILKAIQQYRTVNCFSNVSHTMCLDDAIFCYIYLPLSRLSINSAALSNVNNEAFIFARKSTMRRAAALVVTLLWYFYLSRNFSRFQVTHNKTQRGVCVCAVDDELGTRMQLHAARRTNKKINVARARLSMMMSYEFGATTKNCVCANFVVFFFVWRLCFSFARRTPVIILGGFSCYALVCLLVCCSCFGGGGTKRQRLLRRRWGREFGRLHTHEGSKQHAPRTLETHWLAAIYRTSRSVAGQPRARCPVPIGFIRLHSAVSYHLIQYTQRLAYLQTEIENTTNLKIYIRMSLHLIDKFDV